MIRWAALGAMLRHLTRGKPATRQQRRTFNTRLGSNVKRALMQ
ncbi:hypothetical protein [Micromonospora sp. NPDC049171]